ncbi:menaquinone-dependent protoporphyrinogen oxidase [Nocardia transvalensis]|uniref:Menaquinone-dependent protoporphyrinogen oxidase n=1 Tax=Nocardia transvalensis TaxID=37333 RepID=A0A7W9PIH3_9NOCA|nr:flavodoxin domain-containing protein [Nocardia transvalensis]MBB5916715.1 menaquinone-dependent protoporphyrinogen oxidase [Nocardia transvalensis]
MTHDPVLVAYGSTRGGTAEIAQWIAAALRSENVAAEARSAHEVDSLDDYCAVVIGGALYAGRWHRDARRFVRRFARQLRQRPVWVFGSGPLDDSTETPNPRRIPGAAGVRKAADRVAARGDTLFGGRLTPDARGFPASAMAKTRAGDFRNRQRVTVWATDIAHQLTYQTR